MTNTQLALLNAEMGGKVDLRSPLISDVEKALTDVPGSERATIKAMNDIITKLGDGVVPHHRTERSQKVIAVIKGLDP